MPSLNLPENPQGALTLLFESNVYYTTSSSWLFSSDIKLHQVVSLNILPAYIYYLNGFNETCFDCRIADLMVYVGKSRLLHSRTLGGCPWGVCIHSNFGHCTLHTNTFTTTDTLTDHFDLSYDLNCWGQVNIQHIEVSLAAFDNFIYLSGQFY